MTEVIQADDSILETRALNQVVWAESWRRERIVNHFRFAMFTLIGLAEWAERSGHDHPHLTAVPFLFISWGLTVGAFNFTYLKRAFKAWIPGAITAIDITILTIAIRIIFRHALDFGEETAREIDRAMMGLILLISVNVIRFSWRTSLWSGICALASLAYLRGYSDTFHQTAIITDFLIFAAEVGLLIYANNTFRTTTKRLLFDLRRAQQMRLTSLRTLVAGVSHEVNSPLGAISSNVQLTSQIAEILEKGPQGEAPEVGRALSSLREARETSLKAIERIGSILESLRDFACVDEGEIKRIDLRESIGTCIDLLSAETEGRIEFTQRYSGPLDVMGRPAELNQVFMHLLRNAIESIEGEGEVTIDGVLDAKEIRIDIADTGKGIAKKDIEGIFDLQFGRKGDRVTMGLGLPISRSIVLDHGGSIDIESAIGSGTRVVVRLPLS